MTLYGAVMLLATYGVFTSVPNKSLRPAAVFCWLVVLYSVMYINAACEHLSRLHKGSSLRYTLLAGLFLVGMLTFEWPRAQGHASASSTIVENAVVDDLYRALRDYPMIDQHQVYLTTRGVVSEPLLRYMALKDGFPAEKFHLSCLNLEGTVAGHLEAMKDADLVFATSSGSGMIEYPTPSTLIQDQVLAAVREDPDFTEYRRFATPGGASFYLFERKARMRPIILPVSPSDGQGMAGTFAFRVTHSAGPNEIRGIMVLLNASIVSKNSCEVYYDPHRKGIALANDDGTITAPLTALGSSTVQQNSQCMIEAAGASGSVDGNSVVLMVPVVFKPEFKGLRHLYVYSEDEARHATGWQLRGTWQVK
jgi:hypothetical protein